MVDGEITVLDPTSGTYFGLEHAAARVWEMLATEPSRDEMISRLQDEFEVDEATCRGDVGALLEDLEQRGLVEAR